MKRIPPPDPLDELIAAALDRQLTPEERTPFEARLQTDPAARAAYEEAKSMHTLLEGSYAAVDPDGSFEQRMVSSVRRRLQQKQVTETPWESVLVLWRGLKRLVAPRKIRSSHVVNAVVILFVIAILLGVALGPITSGIEKSKESAAMQLALQQRLIAAEQDADEAQKTKGMATPAMGDVPVVGRLFQGKSAVSQSQFFHQAKAALASSDAPSMDGAKMMSLRAPGSPAASPSSSAGFINYGSPINVNVDKTLSAAARSVGVDISVPQGGTVRGSGFTPPAQAQLKDAENNVAAMHKKEINADTPQKGIILSGYIDTSHTYQFAGGGSVADNDQDRRALHNVAVNNPATSGRASSAWDSNWKNSPAPKPTPPGAPGLPAVPAPAEDPARKLIRNAELELEVKNFQIAVDSITALSRAAGGYVDSSNSQRGGNGKLQGVIVIKVLPGNLDAVLLKLRELGDVRNQSVKTDDVTKDYYDTLARLDNSRKTETQLQELLKRNNGKVADLLEVERELGRVRGQIEQMQGSLKFYDFLVQYATVTIQLKEKDLNQAAAYLLQEQDNFSLFATDVEDTFKKARQVAEDCKAQILNATLNHNSGSDVAAQLVVMVPPEQIETFLAQIRTLGRVADFHRQSQRVAKDGGDSDNPADQTLTEKDKVQVNLTIRSDDESRKQVALVVVAPAVDTALDQAKTATLANAGAEILGSSLNKAAEGQTTGQLRVRVPGKNYETLLNAFRALGRTASFSLQRDDNSGPGVNGDEAPVIISLALTDTDTPIQQTQMSILSSNVDDQAQQIKKDAASSGVEIKASNFARQPDGREEAQLSFRLPMAKYPAFVETLKKLGKVEAFTVNRSDRPDQTRPDDTAPAQIDLLLHNQGDIVADNTGLWATLRQTFGEGTGALFTSIRTIGVLLAFLAPWLLTLALAAWIARRLYLRRKK